MLLIGEYLTSQRAALAAEFDKLKAENEKDRAAIAARTERMHGLVGARQQLAHLEESIRQAQAEAQQQAALAAQVAPPPEAPPVERPGVPAIAKGVTRRKRVNGAAALDSVS